MRPAQNTHSPQGHVPGSALCLWVGGFTQQELEPITDRLPLHGIGARDARQALLMPLPDVLLVEACLPDGDGLALAEELRRRSPGLPIVVASTSPGLGLCRRALRLGAIDVLPRPLDADECGAALGLALADGAATRGRARHQGTGVTWPLGQTDEATDELLRDLLAHLVRTGFGPGLRARVVTAAAELLDNAHRHAAGSGGELHLRTLAGRMELVVRDQGPGFEPERALLRASGEERLLGGLARAVALADEHRIESGDGGSRIQLGFLTPASSRGSYTDDDDWSELDYLSPELARRLLAEVGRGETSGLALPPANAAVVARWLSPHGDRRLAQRVLWS